MKRIVEFDGIRGIAIMAIITCHLAYNFIDYNYLGQYLGGTFNIVFFSLSALLLGCKANANRMYSTTSYWGGNYLYNRALRISPQLWVFLLASIIAYQAYSVEYSIKGVVMNFAMLGWFHKLPGNGHLWFVTMIMCCYVAFFVLSKFHRTKLLSGIIAAASIVLSYGLSLLGLPEYFFIILGMCCILYLHANNIIKYLYQIDVKNIMELAILINGTFLFLLKVNVLHIGKLSYYYVAGVSGWFMFMALFKLFHKYQPNELLKQLSVYSYSLYLMHHPLCNVHYFNEFTHSSLLSIILIVCLSLVLSVCLEKVSQRIYNLIMK